MENEMLSKVWDSLTDEQKEKAKGCKTNEELLKFAGEEGIELPDEALDAVSGGGLWALLPELFDGGQPKGC